MKNRKPHSFNHRSAPQRDRKFQAPAPHSGLRITGGNRLVIGRNCVLEVLKRQPERVVKAFVQGDDHGKPGARHQLISDVINQNKISIVTVRHDELTRFVETDSHQGFALEVKERPSVDLREFIESIREQEAVSILVLDSIQDPQNFGSILRASECFGIDCVIVSRNRGVAVTPVVSKVSVGGSELVTIITVNNLHDAVRKLKDAGIWIAASIISPEAESLSKFEFPRKVALIMGSEGEGIQPLLIKEADFKLYIPQYGQIDSLNVGQATAVFLAEMKRQMIKSELA